MKTDIENQNTLYDLKSSSIVSTSSSNIASPKSAIYRYRCSHCALAFRCETKMRQHELGHSAAFRISHKCPFFDLDSNENCQTEEIFETATALRSHIETNHTSISKNDKINADQKASDLCAERFSHDENDSQKFLVHLKSKDHLNHVKDLLQKNQNDNGITLNNNKKEDVLLQFNEQVQIFLKRILA